MTRTAFFILSIWIVLPMCLAAPGPEFALYPTPHTPTPYPTFTPTPSPTFSGWCFLAGTRVDGPDGALPIETLSIGDRVMAVDPFTGERFIAPVSGIWIKTDPGYLDVHTDDGGSIRTTASHPFFDPTQGEFREIGRFEPGDELLVSDPSGIHAVAIEAIVAHEGPVVVYHLTVDHPLHTFVANGFVVHNKTPTVSPPPPTYTRTPTPSRTPTRTPTATCPPCAPFIHNAVEVFDDTAGECSDGDGKPDAGETVRMVVSVQKTMPECDIYGCSLDVESDHPGVSISPAHVDLDCATLPDSAFMLSIGPDVACADVVTILIRSTTSYCGSPLRYEKEYEYTLEIDGDGAQQGCDAMPCESDRIELAMQDTSLMAGDLFRLTYRIFNMGSADTTYDVWILLGIGGEYWFYPAWMHMSEGLDYEAGVGIDAGSSVTKTVLEFEWPTGVGSIEGAQFIGAICVPGTYQVVTGLVVIDWGSY